MQPGWQATDFGAGVCASYRLYTPTDSFSKTTGSGNANGKLWQLNVDATNTSLNRVGFAPANPDRALIDAQWGGCKMDEITDGTAVSIMFYEDVGGNEKMLQAGFSDGANANSYIDPIDGSASRHWRWANPDHCSGQSKRINTAKNATYTTADPNDGCAWTRHDCGPNSEAFSFHGNGAHAVFADGHVVFVRESTPITVLRALATRNDGRSEATAAGFGE
jgi:prepilin-type processing-associated H-X9-DG protein